jgi:threonine dehydratase
VAKRTPVLPSLTLTQRLEGVVALKAENLQRTGSSRSAAL